MKVIFAWIVLTLTLNLFAAPTDRFDRGKFNTNSILVKPRGPDPEQFHRQHGADVRHLDHLRWKIVKLKHKDDIQKYLDSGFFEQVVLDRIYEAVRIPNDPLFNQQWHHPKMESPAGWDINIGNEVVVAVIDTGINLNHPDLIGNLWTGPSGEHGYTAIGGFLVTGGMDDHFHGSHCAGIIGAVGNNGIGVAGVNWSVKLAAFKFLTAGGSGNASDAILLIDKIIDLKQSGVNIRVSNNSWGGLGFDPALEEAFQEAEANGILNICAAGNDGLDTDIWAFSPASMSLDGIISVLASDQNDNKAGFSNYGSESTDILAPGVSILSAGLGSQYLFASGTSMASPQVAGAMAMVFALNPTLTTDQAKSILLHPDSYDRTAFADNSTAGGRVNLRKLWSNSLIHNPPPANHAPIITLSPNTNRVFVAPGQTQRLSVTAVDPDGDAIFYNASWGSHKIPWFISHVVGPQHFSTGSAKTNSLSVTGSHLALDQAKNIRFTASDGRGKGSSRNMLAWTDRTLGAVTSLPITGFRVWFDASNHPWFRLDMDPAYPNVSSVRYDVRVYGGDPIGGGFGANCCFQPNVDVRATYNGLLKGSYSIRALVCDEFGNFTTSPQATVIVSNSIARPPTLRATFNTLRGPTPLNVTANLSTSSPGNATRPFYGVLHLDEGGVNFDIFNPIRQFTLFEPGVYAIDFHIVDMNSPISDHFVQLFTVLPSGTNEPPPDPPDPPPTLVAPSGLTASASGRMVTLRWTENSSGEDRVEVQISSKDKGPWTPFRNLTSLPANSTSHSFMATVGQHQFRVRVCKDNTCSPFSNVASIRVR